MATNTKKTKVKTFNNTTVTLFSGNEIPKERNRYVFYFCNLY